MIKINNSWLAINSNCLIIVSALAFTLFYNTTFFSNYFEVYPVSVANIGFMLSLGVFIFALTTFLLGLICTPFTTKFSLILLFPCSALASYFMETYNIVIDTSMLQNTFATDLREASDLVSVRMLIVLIGMGLLPATLIFFLKIKKQSPAKAIFSRVSLLTASLASCALLITLSSNHYASFFREHKMLRYYTNPVTYLYSSVEYVRELNINASSQPKQQLGLDAHIPAVDIDRELIILVVGETARADHFSLNGYSRNTNPLLEQEAVLSFRQMQSCATSTALSLPCMFSLLDTSSFEVTDANQQENLLDVLNHANVGLLWRDNNSDSKGVAQAEIFEDFRSSDINPVCDIECRDIGMLYGLDDFIASSEEQDLVIVLHQMGNHGPAYYKRYPPEFEKFTPVCQSAQLEECSLEEINNAYDNAILYTDYFLREVIHFLKKYDDEFETAMLYMSDHGESLGEHNLFLHGLPNIFAPDEQRQVSSILWLGKNYHTTTAQLAELEEESLSHDNYFHTVLGLMEIETDVYEPRMDLIRGLQ